MKRWIGLGLVLCAGYACALAFSSATPRQEPTLPCLPIGGCPTTTGTTTTTTTTETTTSTQSTPPSTTTTAPAPPPDSNAPPVSDAPPKNHPAHHTHSGTTVAVLSDERTYTTWAGYGRGGAATSGPFGHGRRVAALRTLTADRLPEVYVVLRSVTDPHGHVALKIRLPVRPNGTVGWVSRRAVGTFHRVNTLLVVDRRRLRLTLFRAGRAAMTAPIGIGTAQNPTPAGRFWVDERFRVQSAPAYGPYAIGTTAYSPTLTDWPGGGVVGIHGTDQPSLIPGRVSHGCIRLRNPDIMRLIDQVPLGTPVAVR